jgi:hypothetical protein
MVITLECKYDLRIIALTKLEFLMVFTMMRSRRIIKKPKLEPLPVFGF